MGAPAIGVILILVYAVAFLVCIGWFLGHRLRNMPSFSRFAAAVLAPLLLGLLPIVLFLTSLGHYTASGPSMAESPPAPPPDPVLEAQKQAELRVHEQAESIVTGLIIFNPPSRMRVGVSQVVTVRISRDQAERALRQGLRGGGALQTERINVARFMRVHLWGPGFTIKCHGNEDQVVLDQGFAQWLFDVLPVEAGQQTLELQVMMRLKLPGRDEVVERPALVRDVTVDVNRWWDIKQFFGANWQWFLGGIGAAFAGIGAYLGRRWIERRG